MEFVDDDMMDDLIGLFYDYEDDMEEDAVINYENYNGIVSSLQQLIYGNYEDDMDYSMAYVLTELKY